MIEMKILQLLNTQTMYKSFIEIAFLYNLLYVFISLIGLFLFFFHISDTEGFLGLFWNCLDKMLCRCSKLVVYAVSVIFLYEIAIFPSNGLPYFVSNA